MMEVVSLDCVPMKMDSYAETLIWMDEANADSIDADEVICHATNQGVLIQVKAAEFVSDRALAELKPRHVKRYGRALPVPSWKSMRVPFTTCAEMLKHDSGKDTPLWQFAVEYEMARGNLAEGEVIEKMIAIVRILQRSIVSGIASTSYEDRVLGHQSGRFQEMMNAGRLLDGGTLNPIVLYVTALMEVKSSMGVIVAAPTAGACAHCPVR